MKNFVTFEGGEGVGKSTQIKLLKDYVEERGLNYVMTREPGGAVVSEAIREIILSNGMDALTEAFLFAASRAEHVKKLILPALAEGKLVICDRYIDSSIAYQGYARGLGVDNVLDINRLALQDCMPDVTIFIDQHPLNSFRRRKGKVIADDRIENEVIDFHIKVYEGYLKACEAFPDRIVRVEPCEDKLETHERIIDALVKRGIFKC